MILTDIKFKTNLVHKKRADEPTRYQGQVIHNQSMDYAETCRRFAEYLHSNPIMARLYLDSVGGFIAEYVAKGYYLDLGPFTVGLKMRGGFPAANSPFDENVNRLAVEISPSKTIRDSVKSLHPVNVTVKKPVIYILTQHEPIIRNGDYDTITADGIRLIQSNCSAGIVHPGVADEGARIENDDGEILAVGEITRSDACTCDFTLKDHIEPGRHWFVIQGRYTPEDKLLRAKRRVTVI